MGHDIMRPSLSLLLLLLLQISAIAPQPGEDLQFSPLDPADTQHFSRAMMADHSQYHKRDGGPRRMILCMPFGMSCSRRGIRCCGRNNACVCNIFGSNCKCTLGGFLFGKK